MSEDVGKAGSRLRDGGGYTPKMSIGPGGEDRSADLQASQQQQHYEDQGARDQSRGAESRDTYAHDQKHWNEGARDPAVPHGAQTGQGEDALWRSTLRNPDTRDIDYPQGAQPPEYDATLGLQQPQQQQQKQPYGAQSGGLQSGSDQYRNAA